MQQPPNDQPPPTYYPPQPSQPRTPQPPYPYPGAPMPAPQPPKKKRRMWLWIVIGFAVLVVLAAIGAATSGNDASSNTDATPTAQATQQNQPTQAAQPTPTPKPTLTTTQRVQQLASGNASDAKSVKTTYAGNDVNVMIVLNEQLDQAGARDTIMQNCFQIEQALWTGHIAGLDDVNVAFSGPSTDKYGNNTTSPYGECDLGKATAARFNWGNLTAEQAWQAYDLARFYTIIQG